MLEGVLSRLYGLLMWLRFQREVIKAINEIKNRIDALEAATLFGNVIHDIHVPNGVSPKVAWAHACAGEALEGEGTRRYILTDKRNNIMAIL